MAVSLLINKRNESGTKLGITRTRIVRGVRLFIFIGALTAVGVIAFTASKETIVGLKRIKPLWLVITLLLWATAGLFDGLRLAVLSRVGEHRLSVLNSIEVIYLGYFMAAITPFQVGGLPVQLYLMNGWGISPGKASSLLLMRGFLFYGILLATAPLITARMGGWTTLTQVLSGYIWLVILVAAFLIVVSVVFPNFLRVWRERLTQIAKPNLFQKVLVWALTEFGEFVKGVKFYLKPRYYGWLIFGVFLTVFTLFALFAMSATLLAGLGLKFHFGRVMGLSMLATSVLLFVPTPGASGVAEAVGAGLYSMVCPKHLLGVYVVLWRFFSFYLGALVGGIITLRRVSR